MEEDLTIVIPAYNESEAIQGVLRGIYAASGGQIRDVIVVDDGSADNTAELAEKAGARVIRHPYNHGYGAAIKTGIRAAQSEYVLIMDSDGQHCGEHASLLWENRGSYDMVVGQRVGLYRAPAWRMPGKWLLSIMANYITRRQIPDLNSGLRLIRRDVAMRYLHLCPSGFSFSTTITLVLFNRRYNVHYVPFQVQRRKGRSTVSVSTGLDTIILILRIATLFDPLRIFLPLSLLAGAVGVLWEIPYALMGRGVSIGSMLAIVTAVMLFSLGLLCDQVSQLRLERYE